MESVFRSNLKSAVAHNGSQGRLPGHLPMYASALGRCSTERSMHLSDFAFTQNVLELLFPRIDDTLDISCGTSSDFF